MQRPRQIIILSLSIICLQLISDPSKCLANPADRSSITFKTAKAHKPSSLNESRYEDIKFHLNPKDHKRLDTAIGPHDGAMIVAPDGSVVFSKNHQKQLVPASTLKIFTALIAIEHLGEAHRFATDFYMDSRGNLKVKGYGDPLLISESVIDISRQLASKIETINDIILDDSYFQTPLTIPGKNNSLEPYDAPNGALCVNFNTVSFKKVQNTYVSGESQTPLLPFALAKIKSSGLKEGRIMLVGGKDETLQYAGELFQYFFKQAGIQINGVIRQGIVDQNRDKLVLHHLSRFSLGEVITRLMEFSNNFIANQLFLTSGAAANGPPATIEKAVHLSNAYIHEKLEVQQITVVEGSGLSRQNRISAATMIHLLDAFEPYYQFLRKENQEYYKTGTLHDVKSRAGYLEDSDGQLYSFAVLINTPGKTTDVIMKLFRKIVSRQ